MTRKEERVAHAMSFEGKDIESEGLKEIVRLAIYEGSTWADKTMVDKACEYIKQHWVWNTQMIEDFRKAMEE